MGTNLKDINIGVSLRPIFWEEYPEYKIEFNDVELVKGFLPNSVTHEWCLPAGNNNKLKIYFLNKKEDDTVANKDKAIIIDKVSIEGFQFDSFLRAGRYTPTYTKGYLNYAQENNLPVHQVLQETDLRFNGFWELELTWPIFTWIHQTENLGWLYKVNI